MASIIIPAHNESRVIGRTLRTLTRGANPGEFEIVVVCNGCTDETAAIARAAGGSDIHVVETQTASKIHALNLGDQFATHFPRLYMDADILVSTEVARTVILRLMRGDKLAVAPMASFDLTNCSWFIRAYYRIDAMLPSSRQGIGGSGVYALSDVGRCRFNDFPQVVADDSFVRIQFGPEERETLLDCHSTVFPPKSLRNLIKIKTRSHFGNFELQQLFPQFHANTASNRAVLVSLGKKPLLWPMLAVYCGVKIASRLCAWHKMRYGHRSVWERDESSRGVTSISAV